MFKEAGCEVELPALGVNSATAGTIGIALRIKDDKAIPPHSVSLQKALERIGIESPAQVESADRPLESDVVRVYVYAKG